MLYIAQMSAAPVMRSADQGVSFSTFADGLTGSGSPRELAIAYSGNPPRLLMATSKGNYATPIAINDVIFANGFD